MLSMRFSALERHKVDFLTTARRYFRSSVAISPAKKSVTAMIGDLVILIFTFCLKNWDF